MRRFVWRLQRVLDIKAKQELIKTQELFALTEKLAQTRGELLTQQRILIDIFESIAREPPRERLYKQEFFLRHSAATDEKIKRLRAKVKELETRQKEKIAEVLKIRRFKESLQRLKEQAKKKYMEEQEKLEQKQLDETATLSFARPATARGFRLRPDNDIGTTPDKSAGTSESRQTAENADVENKDAQSMGLTAGLQENQI